MCRTREEFIAALGVAEMPEAFGARFDEVMAEYERNGVPFLTDEYIERTQRAFGLFRQKYDFVKKAVKRVRENDFLARYSLLLYHMQKECEKFSSVNLKKFPHGEGTEQNVDFEMAAYFSQLAFAHEMAAFHRAHGVPEDVVLDTLNDCFEATILVCNDCFGRDGSHPRTFNWNMLYLDNKILRIGVLNFEMRKRFTSKAVVLRSTRGETAVLANDHDVSASGQLTGCAGCPDAAFHADLTETDAYFEGHPADPVFAVYAKEKARFDKSEWRLAVAAEDPVINVHIPSAADLSPEKTEAAYRRAAEILPKCYPDFQPKAFTCFSWLMDPQLRAMLPETSRILAFQSRYQRFGMMDGGGMAVQEFLFKKPAKRPEDWVEDTSLQRNVKAFYLKGNYIYAQGGVFFDYLPEQ